MQRKSTRLATSTGITNKVYDEADVSCSFPEKQEIIKVLVSITEQEWSNSPLWFALQGSVKHWYEVAYALA